MWPTTLCLSVTCGYVVIVNVQVYAVCQSLLSASTRPLFYYGNIYCVSLRCFHCLYVFLCVCFVCYLANLGTIKYTIIIRT